MSRKHLDAGDLVEKSSLEQQRRLCGIDGSLKPKALDLLEAKPPWEGDLSTKQQKQVKSALYDSASDLSTLGARFRDTLKKIDDRLLKVSGSAAGMKEYSKLKTVLKKLDRLEAELRTAQGEFSNLAAHVK